MATNLPELSARARKALGVLADGGRFVCRLERNNYTGRDKFAYRLLKDGHVVAGIVSTYYQLRME